jgi:hypothetical protein
MNANDQNRCHFGCLDTKTGEFKEGYIKEKLGKKKMAYRNPLSWWKRMFGMKDLQPLWSEPEYVSSIFLRIEGESHYQAPIYLETHINGEKRYYVHDFKHDEPCINRFPRRPIDTTAFENEGKVLFI